MLVLTAYFNRARAVAPLVSLRILLGLVFALAAFRTLVYGWLERFYLEPAYLFSVGLAAYLPRPSAWVLYALFWSLFLAGLLIALGWRSRYCAAWYALGFTYAEQLDLTHYLNHYYLISLLALLLVFVPTERYGPSLETYWRAERRLAMAPAWQFDVFKFQLLLVYFYAAWAKFDGDWLAGLPLRIWLQDATLGSGFYFGGLLSLAGTAKILAWAGLIFDLVIGFALWYKPSRFWAYLAVLAFHLMTRWLFPIGVFPWLMIGATTIFFEAQVHQKWQRRFFYPFVLILSKLKLKKLSFVPSKPVKAEISGLLSSSSLIILLLYLGFQVLFPLRYLYYGSYVHWHEQGFRYAWRVMLIEKKATALFAIEDPWTAELNWQDPRVLLNAKQTYMMSTQPDMICLYAQELARRYELEHGRRPRVFAKVYVALNGRVSAPFVRETVDLAALDCSANPLPWLYPFKQD